MTGAYFNLVVESHHYLGKTTTLSPMVSIDLLKDQNPVAVCGFLCTTDAPAHPTRGVCKQFYVKRYQIEMPYGNLVQHTAECTFMNDQATLTYDTPADWPAWQNVTDTIRQRYIYDAYSINWP